MIPGRGDTRGLWWCATRRGRISRLDWLQWCCFFNRVTKMRSYIFRNFEEIYGQKVVTALSKVTRAGLLSGQRPILSKKLKKLSPSPPPRPTLRWSTDVHDKLADFWAWAVDFMLFKIVRACRILQRALLISFSLNIFRTKRGCQGVVDLLPRLFVREEHGWAYRLWRSRNHSVDLLRLEMVSYEGKKMKTCCISNPGKAVEKRLKKKI